MTRRLAIGDIHGCANALRTLCDQMCLRDDDVVVTLGDYCDRGPDTRGVFDFLIALSRRFELIALRGNHEIMMGAARESDAALATWLAVGGTAALESYARAGAETGRLEDVPDDHWDFLDTRLVPYHETSTHIFVHANAYPEIPLDEQPDLMLYWEGILDQPRHCSGKWMICGHAQQRSGVPLTGEFGACIDTAACRSGWLTGLHAETGRVWQANEEGRTRTFWLDELPSEYDL